MHTDYAINNIFLSIVLPGMCFKYWLACMVKCLHEPSRPAVHPCKTDAPRIEIKVELQLGEKYTLRYYNILQYNCI